MKPVLDDRPLEMGSEQAEEYIDLLDPYLRYKLLPFWLESAFDHDYGGYLTYFDRHGRRTGKTEKTLIMQMRMIFTFSGAHRASYGGGRCLEAAAHGVDFVLEHFWDPQHRGWYWICDRAGRVLDDCKIMYGQSFGIYALAEYGMASDDPRGREYAEKTVSAIQQCAADASASGYWEMFHRDWSLKPGGIYGGDRKTLDVHMHLMEAFTTLFELTQEKEHRDKLKEVIHILCNRMLDPVSGTGMAQFDRDFRPLPAIIFKDVWGSDRSLEKEAARPLDNTNYGHNIEMAWLLKYAADILGEDIEPYRAVIQRLMDHACRWGVDSAYGGIFVEGPRQGEATQKLKEFWQQAEALVGFLDAALIFKKQRYWEAFERVFDFVWTRMINHEVGEWYALLARDGSIEWDYLGHEWKISYHTVRSVIQSLKRLRSLQNESRSGRAAPYKS
jgi:mannobiose 2-epimerase